MRTKLFGLILFLYLGSAFAAIAADQPAVMSESNKTKADIPRYLPPHSKLVTDIIAAMPEKLSAVSKQPRKVLVIMGWESPLHDSGKAGLLVVLRTAAEKFHAFELTECYDCSDITGDMLKQYDAVVLNNTANTYRKEVTAPFNACLEAYVKAGGGFFANHGSAHSGSPYPQILGIKGYGFPGNFAGLPFPVKVVEPDNPLMCAFCTPVKPTKFTFGYHDESDNGHWKTMTKELQFPHEFADELNTARLDMADTANPIRVLLTLDMDILPKEMFSLKDKMTSSPLIWIRHYGKGKVFFSEFAHFGTTFTIPAITRSMLDGLQYVLGDLTVDEASGKSSNDSSSQGNNSGQ